MREVWIDPTYDEPRVFMEPVEGAVRYVVDRDPRSIQQLVAECHAIARDNGFSTPQSFDEVDPIIRCLCLIHSEVSEALEAVRGDDLDNFSEELADTVIRVFDLCGGLGIDLEWAVLSKMEANRHRPHLHGGKRA